ncbi:MAG: 3-dehydroquinate synthase [Cyclobacteriaceae bacterium]
MQSVIIKKKIGQPLQDILGQKKYSKIGILVDTNTENLCLPIIKNILQDFEILRAEAGEKFKTLETCQRIWEQLTTMGFDRHSVLIVLGGGVLGDMGGFCASTFKRGIDFVLVPTTLLSQVDASVGGKLGIDFMGFKNHIGLFREPTVTLISTDFLSTLPVRELRSGYAEVIKHCLIADQGKWNVLNKKSLEQQNWEDLIDFSFQFKSSIAETDPYEGGVRKILNFGHTIGHAVESCCLLTENPLFHGEAIAVGMITECHISFQKGMLKKADLEEVTNYLKGIFGKEKQLPATDSIMEWVIQDKKNKGNRILMALLEGVGHAVWDVEVNENEIRNSLDYYRSL